MENGENYWQIKQNDRNVSLEKISDNYRTRAIIGRSRFEAALVYKPRILGLKNEEF